MNTCGNPDHPNGAWHPAEPLPASWEWRERLRQWWRRRKWGCGCPMTEDNDGPMSLGDAVKKARGGDAPTSRGGYA